VRIGAGNEVAGRDQALLRKIEVEDAVARCRVIRRVDAVQAREIAADGRLLFVAVLFATGGPK